MSTPPARAAQYIRMSTDRQDLSPAIQREALARFATANALEIVRSYEDEGKSGVRVSNRPQLRQLLRDVADGAPFSEILVYDVSRWGRFQDADAAAYYEYHCRMHGVQVTYVHESFTNDLTPASVLVKSMRRVMAAEYSRDIAAKSRAGQQRVVEMGFHMGALPPLGYRRCSVSADGRVRSMLEHGQRKSALTDRIEWVLAPEPELSLVRRICSAYARGHALEEIAGLVRAEGWLTAKRRTVSVRSLRILLTHEALIGNFVWGVKSKGGKIFTSAPTRMDGSVPRIIDDRTWAQLQARLGTAASRPGSSADSAAKATARAAPQKPRQLTLALDTVPPVQPYRRTLGSAQQLRNHTREFGRALQQAMSGSLPAAFDTRTNVLAFWDLRVRIRLMWPRDATSWLLERDRSVGKVQHVLVVRMAALYRAHDFLLLPGQTTISGPLYERVTGPLRPYWLRSQEELMARMTKICASGPRPGK